MLGLRDLVEQELSPGWGQHVQHLLGDVRGVAAVGELERVERPLDGEAGATPWGRRDRSGLLAGTAGRRVGAHAHLDGGQEGEKPDSPDPAHEAQDQSERCGSFDRPKPDDVHTQSVRGVCREDDPRPRLVSRVRATGRRSSREPLPSLAGARDERSRVY